MDFSSQIPTQNFNFDNPVAGSSVGGEQGFLSKLLGFTSPQGDRTQGYGSLALGGAQTLLNGYLGLQQLDLAKDSLKTSKKQFSANYNQQAGDYNRRLEDVAKARYAANPNAYESPSAYLEKNKAKEYI
jgi:hypothetical protein